MPRHGQDSNEHRTPEDALASVFAFGTRPPPIIAKACYGQMTLSVVNTSPEGEPGLVGVGPKGVYWDIPELNQAFAFVKWEDVLRFTDSHGELTCQYRHLVDQPGDENLFAQATFRLRMERAEDARKLVFLATQFQAEALKQAGG